LDCENAFVADEFATVDELFDALHASRAADDEGGLPILDHCLQCAHLLKATAPDDVELQVAGLVHDLGWLERTASGWQLCADAAHDRDGRRRVEALLGARVASLVGGHVQAKRYLLATDPAYRALLSARSETTLQFQGGVMTSEEAAAFARRADSDDLVSLRRADDAAKVRGKVVPGVDTWRAVVDELAAKNAPS
jgi:predicted HD phosphohydrolase